MTARATKLEYFIFFLAILMLSGGPAAMYVKLFSYHPPLPSIIVEFPILLLLIINIVFRLREAVLGAFAALPFMVLALLALASYKWSLAPIETLKEAVIFIAAGVYIVMAAFLFDWRDIIRMSWLAMLFVSLFALFLYYAMPSLGQMQEVHVGALSGMWHEKNYAGQIGVFGTALTLARLALLPKKILSTLFGLLVFCSITLLSTSRTSLMALILCIALFIWVFFLRRNKPVFLATIWATLIFAVPLASMIIFDTKGVLKLLGRNSTFTGRAQIWEAVMQYSIKEAPRTGYGYNAYWSADYDYGNRARIFEQIGYKANHAHNTLLEMWLSLGIIGVTLLVVGSIAALALSLIKVRHTSGAYFAIPFLGSAIVIGSFESTFATATNFGGAMLILILAKMVRRRTWADAQSGVATLYQSISGHSKRTQFRSVYA